jgi:hypothetical protein
MVTESAALQGGIFYPAKKPQSITPLETIARKEVERVLGSRYKNETEFQIIMINRNIDEECHVSAHYRPAGTAGKTTLMR